eukprot:10669866-Lingulodinium_polyedra.AAC.1
MLTASRTVYAALRCPCVDRDGEWAVRVHEPFLDGGLPRFWKEHSERNHLNGLAATLGVPKAERDFLGRWV